MDNSVKASLKEIGSESTYAGEKEVSEKLQIIVRKAAEITGVSTSLLFVKEESGYRLIHAHGKDDTLIQAAKVLMDQSNGVNGLTVFNNLTKHQDIASGLSQSERKRLQFFAGIPLGSDDDEPTAFLCIADSKTNQLTDTEESHLRSLSDHAITLMQLLKQSDDLNTQKQKLDRYSTLLENSADITFMLDADTGRIRSVNNGVKNVLGYEPDDLNGTLFQELVLSDKIIGVPVDSWFESLKKKNNHYILQINLLDSDNNKRCMSCNFTKEKGQWYVSASDLTDQIEAEKQASELKDKFEKVVDVATDLIYELEWESGELSWGDELTAVLGYPSTERYVDYDWWLDKIHPDDLDHVIKDVADTVESESKKMNLVYRIRTYDGPYKYVMNRNYVDRHEDGTPDSIIGAIVDISDLVKSERKSDQHKQLLEQLADNAWSATWIRDKNGTFIFSNEKYKELFDVTAKKVTNETIDDIFDKDKAEEIRARDKQVLESGDPTVFKQTVDVNGEKKVYKVNLFPLYGIPGMEDIVGGVAMDITSEKNSRAIIEQSLEEKETLLMEIHHRVKNNLAVVSGMMQLQALKETNEEVQEKLFESTGRIKTMATIHELLYKSSSFTDLRFDENIEKLITGITDTFHVSIDLEMSYNMDEVELNINQAIPCSLIVNEVVTNVLKHAYDDGDSGVLDVTLKEYDHTIELRIKDDGKGLPDDFEDSKHDGSLGLELIATLTEQLKGEYDYRSLDRGAEFILTFKKASVRGSASYINRGSAG
jgi:PAS domain S-box-containing protein